MINALKIFFHETPTTYLTFFHNSEHCYEDRPSLFKPMLREENKGDDEMFKRPVFYWFNDSWHSNMPESREKYLYFFVKNPKKENISLRNRCGSGDFDSLYQNYVSFKNELLSRNLLDIYKNGNGYIEPPILMSFSDIEPDLVLMFANGKDRQGVVVKPEQYKGTVITFFDDNFVPIPFINIPEIVEIVPKIKQSFPFVIPEKRSSKYIYEDWLPMITEKGGTWL